MAPFAAHFDLKANGGKVGRSKSAQFRHELNRTPLPVLCKALFRRMGMAANLRPFRRLATLDTSRRVLALASAAAV